MAIPVLPLDILIHIISFLPPSRQFGENTSVHALARFSQASRMLREATCFPSIWERHYRVRYRHANPEMESSPHRSLQSNWRLMYADRRRIDATAVQLLDQILHHRVSRYDYAMALWRLGFDAWDVLELETEQSKPAFFQTSSPTYPSQPYAMTRIFWACSMMQAISRGYAFNLWSALAGGNEDAIPFPEGYSAISCFFGRPPTEACFCFHIY
jgi:F-box protein 21